MSFEPIEKYIHELEALKNYDEVKRQRDELADENAKLKDEVAELEKEIERQKKELERLAGEWKVMEEKLRKKTLAAQKLGGELGKVSNELKALKEFEIKSADGKSLTLQQATGEFLKAQESAIERRANEKYAALKADLEDRMPELVYEKLIQTIGKPPWPKEITGAIEAKAKEIADGILRNKERWPSWFNEFYLGEVRVRISAGLNAEFERRVEAAATERAGRLSDLEAKIKENAVRALEGPWGGVKCDRCGADQGAFKLTEDGISSMLTIGYIEPGCINPHCEDLPAFRRRRKHRIRILIHDLIAAYIRR